MSESGGSGPQAGLKSPAAGPSPIKFEPDPTPSSAEPERKRAKTEIKPEVKAEVMSEMPGSPGSNSNSMDGMESGSGLSGTGSGHVLSDLCNALTNTAQLAMATQLMNLPGYSSAAAGVQQAAYLQALAAASGKPQSQYANMLSLALMQSTAAAAAASSAASITPGSTPSSPSALPKRGRGSRGGSVGRPRGSSMANKLKRLDSGEFPAGRGAGRGRGSRGRRRYNASSDSATAFGNTDYVYYMNESGARGGSYLPGGLSSNVSAVSNGMSPSRSSGEGGLSASFDPYADHEELLFSEHYSGKTCSLCNLSERSALGQGEMIKWKVSSDTNVQALILEAKKKSNNASSVVLNSQVSNSDDENDSSSLPGGNLSDKSPSRTSGSLLNARRKARKFTSGDFSEPVDELENVGFTEEPEHALIFESSGHLFVHKQCALWSTDVTKRKSEEGESENLEKVLIGVEKAVTAAMWQKCAHCKHFGASVKCKASGKFYHFPCGAASGSFMQKSTYLLVGAEYLTKVANLADPTLMYLYHNGESWKYGKITELAVEKFENLLFCTVCGQHYYYTGAQVRITPIIRAGWQCQKCKWCQNCRQSNHEDRYLLCDVCDGAFHAHCLRPQMASIPKNGWKCKVSLTGAASVRIVDLALQDLANHPVGTTIIPCVIPATSRGTKASPVRHVHAQCDPEANESAILEKRLNQPSYLYVCKICKAPPRPSAVATAALASGSQSPKFDDNSNDGEDSMSGMDFENGRMGIGKGKPMAMGGKRGRRGTFGFMGGRSTSRGGGNCSPSGGNNSCGSSPVGWKGVPNKPAMTTTTPMPIGAKARVNEVRRRGRQPKIRGMVGLQRPQAEPGMKEEDEEVSKMICVSLSDEFTLKQDICVSCGSVGNDLEGRLIGCTQCGQCYHPHCANVRVTKVILEKGWRCLDCLVCEGCGDKHDEANLILCDECDISCAVCHMCGSNDPGFNSPWFDNFTLCGPCQSISYCIVCEENYEDGELMIQCFTCLRWCHGECDSILNEEDAEKCAKENYTCQMCRPNDILPPHLAQPTQVKKSIMPSPPRSPDYMGYSHYSNASFINDGVCLTERGMAMLKSQTVEKEKSRRRKRAGLNPMESDRAIFDSIESVVAGGGGGSSGPGIGSADTSLENDGEGDDDDDLMPPPTPGGNTTPGAQPKDGDVVRPLPDGRPPEAPEGFSVVVKDNGVMVLRKRRYRDLKKVGIGGFQAKSRATNKNKSKDDGDSGAPGEEKPKKRAGWRPKKNKILAQYPEYIQESFFGRDCLDSCSGIQDTDDLLEKPTEDDPSIPGEGSTIVLGKEALEAVAEMKKQEEEQKRKQEEEVAAKKAEEEAAKAALALASGTDTAIKDESVINDGASTSKDTSLIEDDALAHGDEDLLGGEDDLLPSDIFGDDLFKFMNDEAAAEGLEDIDESALEEAEKEDENGDDVDNKHADEALAEAFRDTLGPDFKLNPKDIADIMGDVMDGPGEVKEEEEEQGDMVPESHDQHHEIKSEIEDAAMMSPPPAPLAPPATSLPVVSHHSNMQALPSVGSSSSMDTMDTMSNMSGMSHHPQQTQHSPIAIPSSLSEPFSTSNMQQSPHQQQPVMSSMPMSSLPSSSASSMIISSSPMHHSQHQTPISSMMDTNPVQQSPTIMHPATVHLHQQQQQVVSQHQQVVSQHQVQPQMQEMVSMAQSPQQHMMMGGPQQAQQPIHSMAQIPHSMAQIPHSMAQQQPHSMAQQQQQLPHSMGHPHMNTPVSSMSQPPTSMPMPPQQPRMAPPPPGAVPIGGAVMRPPGQYGMVQPNPGPQQPLNVQTMPHGPMPHPGMPPQPSPNAYPMNSPQFPPHTQEFSSSPQQSQQLPSPALSSDSQGSWTTAPPAGTVDSQPPAPTTPTPAASSATSSTQKNQLLKWESDEPLGENATIAMILYSNKNHPNLKPDYPVWSDRIKQIAKIWKTLPNEKRQQYVQQARENRTANRVTKQNKGSKKSTNSNNQPQGGAKNQSQSSVIVDHNLGGTAQSNILTGPNKAPTPPASQSPTMGASAAPVVPPPVGSQPTTPTTPHPPPPPQWRANATANTTVSLSTMGQLNPEPPATSSSSSSSSSSCTTDLVQNPNQSLLSGSSLTTPDPSPSLVGGQLHARLSQPPLVPGTNASAPPTTTLNLEVSVGSVEDPFSQQSQQQGQQQQPQPQTQPQQAPVSNQLRYLLQRGSTDKSVPAQSATTKLWVP
eukprot:TCALIF_02490-PA protein Name:"Similar to Kmt2c Histone-lysine N-methyltransferase 2C (Mus musculus)" AED:0.04 eAED:0.11 QI:0/0.63/0.25/1/0.81/0.66/12/0/2215